MGEVVKIGDKRKNLEGLSGGSPGKLKYHPPATRNDQIIFKEWKPSSGVNLEKDHVIIFHMKTGPNELVRYVCHGGYEA
jgi:hypothetical protein